MISFRLKTIFETLEIESAEDRICGFEDDFQVFQRSQEEEHRRLILEHLRNVTGNPDIDFVQGEKQNSVLNVHEKDMHHIEDVVHSK